MESPRHRIISAHVSPMVEMARWLFERYTIPYSEEAHVPILHVLATRRVKGGNEVPVVVSCEGIWKGAREFLFRLDAKTAPGHRLLGETPQERTKNLGHIDKFFALLLLQVRRYVYFHLLPRRRLLYPVVTQKAPYWERSFVGIFYPLWRRLMAKGLDLSSDLVLAAPSDIVQAFAYAEELLADGRSFIGGETPGIVDIVFSSLVAPLVLPANYGAQLPILDDLPSDLRKFTDLCRERRAGQLALATYAAARNTPPLLSSSASESNLVTTSRLLTPRFWLHAANLLRRFAPRLVLGRLAIFSTWNDVVELLSRDLEFLIAPVNAAKIDAVTGPFILGLDRGEKLVRERGQIYAALAAIDFSELSTQARFEARRLIEARAENGRIDVVNGYARLVAARTAVLLFGISGPTEAELMRVARLAFHYIFLSFGDRDSQLKRQAIDAGTLLKDWIAAEIKNRSKPTHLRNDVLGALLSRRKTDSDALDDDGVCRAISGLLVGSIDTTATAVAQIIFVLLNNPNLRDQLEHDFELPDRALGWCWEALRVWPHNPILLRHAIAGTTLGGRVFTENTTVIAVTSAAMNDPSAFPFPNLLDPSRPQGRYLHFGGGLHPCAGRSVNALQVPLLARELVTTGVQHVAKPRFRGPFIDELLVTLRTSE